MPARLPACLPLCMLMLHSSCRWIQQERERQQMADMIKKQYLGGEKLKKKMLKPSEKFKFNFDWEAGDDTSKDLNPLYNNTHEAQLLFGRGLRAGVDRREQKKVSKASVLPAVLPAFSVFLQFAA